MKKQDSKAYDNLPFAPIGIIALPGCEEFAEKIDRILVKNHGKVFGKKRLDLRDSYIIDVAVPRFGSGESKGELKASVRGMDIYIIVDVTNHSITYPLFGYTNPMSPDDHFNNLKRIISAMAGTARRINVIMPYLYESRQATRVNRQSIDCAVSIQELINLGVSRVLSFEAHDPRIQNAIPVNEFETVRTSYAFVRGMAKKIPNLTFSPDKTIVISPDSNGMNRSIYLANNLGLDMGMFYRRRDYATLNSEGHHPVISQEYLGSNIAGKDTIVVDDIISSGETLISTAQSLKKRGARRVIICATFGLFTRGFKDLDAAYHEGSFDYLLTTNLVYQPEELKKKPYYINCDMSKYVASLIDTLNHDATISYLLNPSQKIQDFLTKFRNA